jgi:Transcriptional regulators
MEKADGFIRQLYQTTRIIAKELNRRLGQYELYSSEWTVIASIKEKGTTSQIMLAEYLNIEPAAISKSLVALEKKGLIKREEGSDKREKMVSLTPKALILYPKWEEIVRQHRRQILNGISDKKLDDLSLILETIFSNAQDIKKIKLSTAWTPHAGTLHPSVCSTSDLPHPPDKTANTGRQQP